MINHNILYSIIGNRNISNVLTNFRIIGITSHFNIDQLWWLYDGKRWRISPQFISLLLWHVVKAYLSLLPNDRHALSDSRRRQHASLIILIRNIGSISEISWATLDTRRILAKLTGDHITLCKNWTLSLVYNLSRILIRNGEVLYSCCLRRSIAIGNRIYSSNSIDTFQFLRHISIAKLPHKAIELCHRLRKLQFRIISIEIVSNRRHALRKLTMIDISLNNIHDASHHVLLGNLAHHVMNRKISIYPNLCHRALVYTDVILLHSKGTEMLRQLSKAFERLGVQMQEIGIGYVFDVRESDRRFFQEKLLLV